MKKPIKNITQERKTLLGHYDSCLEGIFVLDTSKHHEMKINLGDVSLKLNITLSLRYRLKHRLDASKGNNSININICTHRNKKSAFTLCMEQYSFSFMFYRNFIIYVIEVKKDHEKYQTTNKAI